MRVWDVRKPFRPLLEKTAFKQCRTVNWLPNGAACLGGACSRINGTDLTPLPASNHTVD
jgi:hypothetical protein